MVPFISGRILVINTRVYGGSRQYLLFYGNFHCLEVAHAMLILGQSSHKSNFAAQQSILF